MTDSSINLDGPLGLGSRYSSFFQLQRAIETYCKRNNVKLFRSDSRKLKSAPNRVNPQIIELAPEELVYYSLTYSCVFGGKSFKSRSRGVRPEQSTFRQGCKFVIRIGLTRDCRLLEVTKLSDTHTHNHDCLSTADSQKLHYNVNGRLIPTRPYKRRSIPDVALSGSDGRESHMRIMAMKMAEYQRANLFCDTAIVAKDGMVFAHSSVLAMSCPHLFASLNQKPFVNHQPNMIDMSKYDTVLVNKMVDFFYTGQLCMNSIVELQEMCGHLGIVFEVDKAEVAASDSNVEDLESDGEIIGEDDDDDIVGMGSIVPVKLSDKLIESLNVKSGNSKEVNKRKRERRRTVEIKPEDDAISVDSNSNQSGNLQEIPVKPTSAVKIESPSSSSAAIDAGVDLIIPKRIHGRRCAACYKVFLFDRDYTIHRLVHCKARILASLAFRCKVCEEHFTNTCALNAHMNEEHCMRTTYNCGTCKRQFLRLKTLLWHERQHSTPKDEK